MTFDIFTEEGLRSSGYQIDTRMISLFKKHKLLLFNGYIAFVILAGIATMFCVLYTKPFASMLCYYIGYVLVIVFYVSLVNALISPSKRSLSDKERFDYNLYTFHHYSKKTPVKNKSALFIAHYEACKGDFDACNNALKHITGVAGLDRYLQKSYDLILFVVAIHNGSYELAEKYLAEYSAIEIKYDNTFISSDELSKWLSDKALPENVGKRIAEVKLSHTNDGCSLVKSYVLSTLSFFVFALAFYWLGFYFDPYFKISVLASSNAILYLWSTVVIIALGLIAAISFNWRLRFSTTIVRAVIAGVSAIYAVEAFVIIKNCTVLALKLSDIM